MLVHQYKVSNKLAIESVYSFQEQKAKERSKEKLSAAEPKFMLWSTQTDWVEKFLVKKIDRDIGVGNRGAPGAGGPLYITSTGAPMGWSPPFISELNFHVRGCAWLIG